MNDSDANPSWKLSTVLLNGENFLQWSRAIRLSLGSKKKSGFIDGDEVCPESSDDKHQDWISSDQLVRSWILNSMIPRLSEIFSFSESAKELWNSVTELYGHQNNIARVYELKLNLARETQGEKLFSEHLGNLKRMWDELRVYRPPTTDLKILTQRDEEDKVLSLLGSLKPDYDSIISSIIRENNLPSLSSICAIIQREETRKKAMSSESSKAAREVMETSALMSDNYKNRFHGSNEKGIDTNRNKGRKSSIMCEHCRKPGHSKEKCWILHPHLKPKFETKQHVAAAAETSFSMDQIGSLLQQISKSLNPGRPPHDDVHPSSGSKDEEDDW